MLRCLGKNIFLLQSVPLFAGLFQELVYGMGPILLKCTQDVVVQGLVTIFFIPRQTTVKTTREECQIFIQHFFKIVLYWCLDLICHNVGTCTLWSIINIFLIFLLLFVIIIYLFANFKQFLTEFTGFEILFHVVYMWSLHMRSDWSNWPIKSHIIISYGRSHM